MEPPKEWSYYRDTPEFGFAELSTEKKLEGLNRWATSVEEHVGLIDGYDRRKATEFIEAERAKIEAAKPWTESAADTLTGAAKSLVYGLGGVAMTVGETAANIISAPLGLTDEEESFQSARIAGANLDKQVAGGRSWLREQTDPVAEQRRKVLEQEETSLKNALRYGEHPTTPSEFQDWMVEKNHRIVKAAAAYHHPDTTEEEAARTYTDADRDLLRDPKNQQLLLGYQRTRDPAMWESLMSRLTQSHAARQAERTTEKETAGFNETEKELMEYGTDPLELGTTLGTLGLGKIAAVAGKAAVIGGALTKGQRMLQAAKAAATLTGDVVMESASEALTTILDDPLSTPEQIAAASKEAARQGLVIAMLGGLGGLARRRKTETETQTTPSETPSAPPAPTATELPAVLSNGQSNRQSGASFDRPALGPDGTVFGQMPATEFEADLNTAHMAPETAAEAQAFGRWIGQDFAARLADYQSQFGNHISADNWREMHPQWRESNGQRNRLSPALGVPAGKAAQMTYDAAVSELRDGEVLMLAGGQGSGKTIGLSDEVKQAADVIYDNTFSDPARAENNIRKALQGGNRVHVRFAFRPLEEAVHGSIVRAADQGRIERPAQMAATHRNSQQTFLAMAEKFAGNPNVEFRVWDSTGITPQTPKVPVRRSLEWLKKQAYQQPVAELQRRANLVADEHLQANAAAYPPEFIATYQAQAGLRRNDEQSHGGKHAQASREAGAGGGPGASSLKEWKERKFSKRIVADERLRKAWRDKLRDRQYRKQSEAEWQATANEFISERGIEGAAELFFDPDSGLAESDRMALGQQLTLRLEADTRKAEAEGRKEDVEAMDEVMLGITEDMANRGTKMGQAIRALGMWTRMSAAGVLAKFTRKIDEAREKRLGQQLGTDTNQVQAKVETALKEETADVTDEALGVTETEKLQEMQAEIDRLRKELLEATAEAQAKGGTPTGAEADAKRKKAQAKLADAEKRKADRLAKKQTPKDRKKPKPISPEKLAEQAINKLASTLSDTPSPQAKAKQVSQVKQLSDDFSKGKITDAQLLTQLQSIGVPPAMAQQLVQLLKQNIANAQSISQLKQGQAKQDAKAKLLNDWINRLAESQSDTVEANTQAKQGALAKLIRDYLKAEPDVLPDFMSEAVALGANEAQAGQLLRLLDKERANLAALARERAIARLAEQLTPKLQVGKVKDKMPRFLKKLFEAHDLGALSRPEILKAYAEAFELPQMDAAMQRKVRELIDRQKAAPEGHLKQEATTELMAELAKFEGVSVADVGMAYWYANILSALSTQGVNLLGNGIHLFLRAITSAATSPRDASAMLQGMLSGARRGIKEAQAALTKGTVPYKGELNFTAGQSLELIHTNKDADFWSRVAEQLGTVIKGNGSKWSRTKAFMGLGKAVFRSLSAGDAFFFHTAREGQAYLLASRYARQQVKVQGGSFASYMAEQLHHSVSDFKAAQDQARTELQAMGKPLKIGDIDRRAWEIAESMRPPELVANNQRFGARVSFNHTPEGLFGSLAEVLNFAHQAASIPTRWGEIRLLAPVIPFVNIVCNVASSGLDFTPVGIIRGIRGKHLIDWKPRSKDGYGDFSEAESRERLAAGIIGTVGMVTAYSLASALGEQDDDRVPFMIYGMGPETKTKRAQMPQGWKPYSIKLGKTYISFSETPLAIPLSVVGGLLDKQRYGKQDAAQQALSSGYVMSLFGGAMLKAGTLSSMDELFSMIQGEKDIGPVVARTGSGFIPGQGLLRDISLLMDGHKIDDTTLAAAFFKDVPFLRNMAGRPALNIFGEEVKLSLSQRLPVVGRLVNGQGEDPVCMWLAQNKLWLTGADTVQVGDYLTKPEKAAAEEHWRDARTHQLGRALGGVLSESENRRFTQIAGRKIKEQVRVMMADKAVTALPPDKLQDRLNQKVSAARRAAMRQVVGLDD